MKTSVFRAARITVLLAAAVSLAGVTACGHLPWHRKAPTGPEAVNELQESAAAGRTTQLSAQDGKRNTLAIERQSAATSGGTLTLKPRDGEKWPVPLAFRVMPNTLGLIEVQADQRL